MRNYQQGSWLSPATARAFLESLANLPDSPAVAGKGLPQFRLQIRELERRFPTIFKEIQPLLNGQGAVPGFGVKEPDDPFLMAVMGLAKHIRAAWNASQNPREAEWIIFELRRLYQTLSARALPPLQMSDFDIEVPREDQKSHTGLTTNPWATFVLWGWWPNRVPWLTTFEQVMYRFQKMLPQARQCANSECENPYFFASGRRKFCSAQCARTGQREYKLKWWNEKGKKRREQKQRLKKESRRRKT
jgi:hypothetical protein